MREYESNGKTQCSAFRPVGFCRATGTGVQSTFNSALATVGRSERQVVGSDALVDSKVIIS